MDLHSEEEDNGAGEEAELAEKDKQVERDLNRTQAAWKKPFLGAETTP